ncbi:MAG: LysR family transcriptional regulator [Pseudomonadota bacterium]
MNYLKRMIIFSHVVEAESFSGAARRLGIAKSAISKHISLLEKEIGVRLLNRTTRRLSLTEIGKVYYKSCANIAVVAEEANRQVQQLKKEPLGSIKISAPVSFGSQFIAPAIHQFIQKHKLINIELLLHDHVVDLVEQGIDIAVRIGWLKDSSLFARKICESPRLLCASPEYIQRKGLPECPEDLLDHECIIFSLLPTPRHWIFSKNNQQQTIQVNGRIKTNSTNALRSFLLQGAGISTLSNFLISEDIKAGNLVPLLTEYDIGSAGVYAVLQSNLFQQVKVRLFIDFLNEYIPEKL